MKYLIMGAGPAGLSFANAILKKGEEDFIVLEREECAGGLCRSVIVDNAPLDIGGGHFLDVHRPKVNDFLFGFMPRDEWNLFTRDSRISIAGKFIQHPFESNIWQLDIDEQVAYLKSIAQAGCNIGKQIPDRFIEWISWKLGDKIAKNYMLPYNKKMFGNDLDDLGTYWLDKLPNVNFEDTLRSCLLRKACGSQPGHAQFFYPKKYGYGEVWLRMAKKLEGRIKYNKNIQVIDFGEHKVKTTDGSIYKAENIITTIPWQELSLLVGMPKEMQRDIKKLKYSSLQISYCSDNIDTPAQWIYYPDETIGYHRILVRRNFSFGSTGYWTETRKDRVPIDDLKYKFAYLNRYAYPLNTIKKPQIMQSVLEWSADHGVFGLGRWGEHQHYNSDYVVELALKLADQLVPI